MVRGLRGGVAIRDSWANFSRSIARGGTLGQQMVGMAFVPAVWVQPGVRSATSQARPTRTATRRARIGGVRMTATVVTNPEKKLKIQRGSDSIDSFSGDLLVIGLPEQKDAEKYELSSDIKALDDSTSGAISEILEENKFSGKASSKATARLVGSSSVKRVAVFGLGDDVEKAKTLRELGAFSVSTAKAMKGVSSAGVYVGQMSGGQARSITEGAVVASYSDVRFRRTPEDQSDPPSIELLALSDDSAIEKGRMQSSGLLLAKELVDAPANFVTPAALAETAEKIAKDHGLEVEIFDKEKCEEMGMGSYLAVAQAGANPPKFIHLTYKGKNAKKKVVIIGKGLTFDSGGYNLKAGAGSMIEKMKLDMGGSAAALGAANVIGQLKPDGVEVHFIVASCENMISGDGLHPGDIVTASNGTTIEVLNTDAEGRLTLADALIFAENLGDVDYIVDLATLTGAIVVSLGSDIAGLWSSSDDLAEKLMTASNATGEKMWRMPLPDEYKEMIKGSISDLKNIGGRGAGSITAALFLKEFVKSTPWAHIDIAGTAYSEKAGGGTGYGVRTLVELVSRLSDGQ
mmetsp:Transcript_2646/g.7960  ORF Transcript_2646/g.7960 Transcript_2646/m.7960 type:complete len:574 (-) Transcript_2646:1965-3686(-)